MFYVSSKLSANPLPEWVTGLVDAGIDKITGVGTLLIGYGGFDRVINETEGTRWTINYYGDYYTLEVQYGREYNFATSADVVRAIQIVIELRRIEFIRDKSAAIAQVLGMRERNVLSKYRAVEGQLTEELESLVVEDEEEA